MKRILGILVAVFVASQVYGQCVAPTSLTVTNTSASTATLSFVSAGNSPWQVRYGPAGFNLGNGTTVNVTSKSPTINGLSGASTFDIYVRDTCNGLVSAWVGPILFSTSCVGVASTPQYYNFDSPAWVPTLSLIHPGTLANCWEVPIADSLFSWTVGPSLYTLFQTGPNLDHTTGLGKYLHVGSFGLSNNHKTELSLPRFDLVGLSTPQLTFWYHMYGAGIEELVVLAKTQNAGNWDTLQVIVGQQHFSKTDTWSKSVLSLSDYLNDTIEVQFVGSRTGYSNLVEISIDDLSIADIPACAPSTTFQVISNNQNSVTLDWVPASASHWQIEYGASGFYQGTGTTVNTSIRPFKISGLTPNTKYDFYLRDSCSAVNKSSWVGPITIETDCSPIYAPYAVDFEDSTWIEPMIIYQKGTINSCWKKQDSSIFYWDTGPPYFNYYTTGPAGDHTTGNGKYIHTERNVYWGHNFTSITTPIIDLDTINSPHLSFWYHLYGGTIGGLEVAIDSGSGFHTIVSIIGQQQTAQSQNWKESITQLPGYVGKKVKIRFKGFSAFTISNLSRIAIDDFYLGESPPCPKPLQLEASNISYSQASISWTTGGANHWIVKYRNNQGLFNYVSSNSNPMLLSGLQAGEKYEVWVRDSCGLGNVSDWQGPLEFITQCTPKLAPYFENFDGAGFVRPPGYLMSGSLDNCWSRNHDEGFYWESGPPYFVLTTTGPIGDHTTGGGKYLVSDLVNFVVRDTTYVVTPEIDLTALSVPEMSFWYHMFGSGISALHIEIDSGNGWNLLDTIVGQKHVSKVDPWTEHVIDLSGYSQDTIELRFVSIRKTYSTQSEIAIDDLSVYEYTSCDEPRNLSLQDVSSVNALVSWTTGGANNWMVKYSGTGIPFTYLAASTSSNFNVSGLLPDTRYELWVRDSCAVGDVSLWVGPIIIKTECTPTQTPYYESFDGGGWIPANPSVNIGQLNSCWRVSDSTYLSWIPYTGSPFSTISGPTGPRSGSGNFIAFNNVVYSLPLLSSEIKGPSVIVKNLLIPELNFWYHMYGQHTGKLEVFIEQPNGSRILLHTITGQQHNSKIAPWTQLSIPLSAYKNDTVKVVFKGYKSVGFSGAFNISIDDVEIVDGFCSTPTNLASANATVSSIQLSWQTNQVRSNLEYGPQGFTQGQGTLLHNVSSPHVLTGLQSYTTYDFYVQDSCRASNSTWAGPQAFTTYCETPTADFNVIKQSLTINFDASISVGNQMNYLWDFGDGTSGGGVNPSHVYANSNIYLVTLVAVDACGQTDTIQKTISVCDPPLAVVNYSINGLVVSFDGTSSIGAVSYYWDFGPGGIFINDKPVVAFPSKSTFSIYLAVTDSCGGVDTAFVELNLCEKPIADFSYEILSSGGNGMTVAFDGTFSQKVDRFDWNFGDGNSDTTTLTPTHTYSIPSLQYQVTLIAYNDCGTSDTLSYKLADVVSVDEEESLNYRVYPIPAKEKLILESQHQLDETNFNWFDMAGRQLEIPAAKQGELIFEFDVSKLPSAQYLLLIVANGESRAIKITVE